MEDLLEALQSFFGGGDDYIYFLRACYLLNHVFSPLLTLCWHTCRADMDCFYFFYFFWGGAVGRNQRPL